MIKSVLNEVSVVFATCVGSFDIGKQIGSRSVPFDLCVVDEAAQGLEMASWIPILQSKRVVLGGDHKQLSTVVLSAKAEANGLSVTLFERVKERLSKQEGICHLLTTQYRMNRKIMGWSNQKFYHNRLIADDSVADQILDIVDVPEQFRDIVTCPFVFCDTAGIAYMEEKRGKGGNSKSIMEKQRLLRNTSS